MREEHSRVGRARRVERCAFAIAALITVPALGAIRAGSASGTQTAAGCAYSWINPSGGAWRTASNWSTDSVPTYDTSVCITMAGNYTVTIPTGNVIVDTLTLGSVTGTTTQVLDLEGRPNPTPGGPPLSAFLSFAKDSTINSTGKLVLDSQAGGGVAGLHGPLGQQIKRTPPGVPVAGSAPTLANYGVIESQVEGTVRYASGVAVNYDELGANLVNNGTVLVHTGELRQDTGTTVTNHDRFVTEPRGMSTITALNASFVNEGTVTNQGEITVHGYWAQSGGSESGHPVTIVGGSLSDSGTTGSRAAFDLNDEVGLAGRIAAGESIDVVAIPAHGAAAVVSSGLINDGTITLDSQAGGGVAYVTDNSSAEPLINNGSIYSEVESTSYDALEANLINHGTLTVRSGELRQDGNTTTTNDGDVILGAPGRLLVTAGNDVFNEQPHAKLTFDIAGSARFGTLAVSGGATLDLDGGTAAPTLERGYAPTIGTRFEVIAGPHGTGRFDTITNGFVADYSNPAFVALVRTLHP